MIIADRSTLQVLFDPHATHDRAGVDLRDFSVVFGNRTNDRIFMASPRGAVVCMREIGAQTAHSLRDPNEPIFGTIPKEEPNQAVPVPGQAVEKAEPDDQPKP
jgi:hypothetical protein